MQNFANFRVTKQVRNYFPILARKSLALIPDSAVTLRVRNSGVLAVQVIIQEQTNVARIRGVNMRRKPA